MPLRVCVCVCVPPSLWCCVWRVYVRVMPAVCRSCRLTRAPPVVWIEPTGATLSPATTPAADPRAALAVAAATLSDGTATRAPLAAAAPHPSPGAVSSVSSGQRV